MVVLSLHALVLVVILIAMMQAGCASSGVRTASSSASQRHRIRVDRVYDSPTGPDLYRVQGPSGTSYHRQGYVSPTSSDVACKDVRP